MKTPNARLEPSIRRQTLEASADSGLSFAAYTFGMTNFDQSKHPRTAAGTSKGGQFAEKLNSAPESELSEAPNHGVTPNLHEGSRSPWGEVQYVSVLGVGAVSVGTAGHGGIKLSPERNRLVPDALRRPSGWYEEDCEAAIVLWAHPDLSQHSFDAEASVKQWFPDEYEQATGREVLPGESTVRDEALFEQAHVNDWILSAARSESDGEVHVWLRRPSDGAERQVRVSASAHEAAVKSSSSQRKYALKDGDWLRDVTPPPVEKVPAVMHRTVPNLDGLTSSARDRARKDLSQRWRDSDGSVQSLGEIIETQGVSGKRVTVENGRRSYGIEQREFVDSGPLTVYPVSKALYDALDVPDVRSRATILSQDAEVAEAALRRKQRDFTATQADRDKVAELRAAARAAFDEQIAERRQAS